MAGFNELMSEPWGRKAVRISIAIGRDTDYEILQKFIGNSEMTVLEADNPEMLVRRIRWVSTAVLQSVSSPNSQQIGTTQTVVNVPIPTTENTPTLTTGNIVW
jgi:hypothetical protein